MVPAEMTRDGDIAVTVQTERGNRVDGCSLCGVWRHAPAVGVSCFAGCDCCLVQVCCCWGVPGAACYARRRLGGARRRFRLLCLGTRPELHAASHDELDCVWATRKGGGGSCVLHRV